MMKSIKQVLSEDDPSPWTGSEKTFELVKAQVAERWGKEEAEKFRASHDARTFKGWLSRNLIVKKGQTGLESFVLIEKKNERGEVIKRVHKKIWLFHRNQVSPLK